ncbi:sigma-70 family RNA polymerase sigma factor [Chitinophaga sp. YIM B06452]|uniref:RNA polymerase sigma factor n=1 Tax=Chitinophaga sp. YIM B06452 TaxID=3082158 RepID=UPI0031FED55E
MPTDVSYDVRELLTRVADGDEAAFQSLFERYRSPFFGVCMKLSGAREVAEEVVQETFIRIWEKRQHLRDLEKAQAYLYRMFRNVLFEYFRHMAAERKAMGAILDHYDTGTDEGVSEKLRLEARLALLQESLRHLTPQQANVFRLIRLEGLSRNEAADRLGISPHTVRNLLAEATRVLRTKSGRLELAILFFLSMAES